MFVAAVAFLVIGEIFGDVYAPYGDVVGTEVLNVVIGLIYVTVILYWFFVPGAAMYLFAMSALARRRTPSRAVMVVASPIVAVMFLLFPALPEDREGNVSGWVFALLAAGIFGSFARVRISASAASA